LRFQLDDTVDKESIVVEEEHPRHCRVDEIGSYVEQYEEPYKTPGVAQGHCDRDSKAGDVFVPVENRAESSGSLTLSITDFAVA
jgi:hypothetical protein